MDEKSWKALARLSSTEEGQQLLEILRQRREEARDLLEDMAEPREVYRAQGECRALCDLIENIEQARDVVSKKY